MNTIIANVENVLKQVALNEKQLATLNQITMELNVMLKHSESRITFNKNDFQTFLDLFTRQKQFESLKYALNQMMTEVTDKPEVKE